MAYAELWFRRAGGCAGASSAWARVSLNSHTHSPPSCSSTATPIYPEGLKIGKGKRWYGKAPDAEEEEQIWPHDKYFEGPTYVASESPATGTPPPHVPGLWWAADGDP